MDISDRDISWQEILKETLDFIIENPFSSVSEKYEKKLQNVSMYYQTIRSVNRFQSESKKRNYAIKLWTYTYPDLYLTYLITEIVTDKMVIPFAKYIYTHGRGPLIKIITMKYGKRQGDQWRRNLQDPLTTGRLIALGKKTHNFFYAYSKRKPLPLIRPLDRITISVAQHITTYSKDIYTILELINIGRKNKFKHGRHFSDFVISSAIESLDEQEKIYRPKIMKRSIASAINISLYYLLYLLVSKGISILSEVLIRNSMSLILDEDYTDNITAVIWLSQWISFILISLHFLFPTIKDIHRGYREDYHPDNCILHDLKIFKPFPKK